MVIYAYSDTYTHSETHTHKYIYTNSFADVNTYMVVRSIWWEVNEENKESLGKTLKKLEKTK